MAYGRYIYLVKRGLQPAIHKAPYHPVIICTRRHTAQWEANDSNHHAWVWEHPRFMEAPGWLLVRWNGFDVDYGHVVHTITMPDGTQGAFVHERDRAPWTLLPEAVWWSDEPIPEWLIRYGVRQPDDEFSQELIRMDAGMCLLPMSQQTKLMARRAEQALKGE
jgi:hypothetical protein